MNYFETLINGLKIFVIKENSKNTEANIKAIEKIKKNVDEKIKTVTKKIQDFSWDSLKNRPPIQSGTGSLSIVENGNNIASGSQSHAEGYNTKTYGLGCHAEGGNSKTKYQYYAHAEGESTEAGGRGSHSEGYYTQAAAGYTHAEGYYTEASGYASHSEGYYTTVKGSYSHTQGYHTSAYSKSQHVFGEYNIIDGTGNTPDTEQRGKFVEIVGNGDANTASNARTLDWSGNEWLAGELEASSIILRSTTANSTKTFRVTVDDTGTLTATEIIPAE